MAHGGCRHSDVYDPCTVISIGVFDNGHLQGVDFVRGPWHQRIGRVRIRLSTLEMNCVYTLSYPLVVIQASRFSLINTINTYLQPLLPKMHYLSPLSIYQLNAFRRQVVYLISLTLSNSEPPLKKEIRNWANPATTILIYIIFLLVVCFS
ncbi:ft-interacting protein 1 [Quercus suber]|uniref:Ft-interacting protein 1 n=1 Tax=Quercus suber TaxID=58331 RepID=A0AAW0KVX5_QUESU